MQRVAPGVVVAAVLALWRPACAGDVYVKAETVAIKWSEPEAAADGGGARDGRPGPAAGNAWVDEGAVVSSLEGAAEAYVRAGTLYFRVPSPAAVRGAVVARESGRVTRARRFEIPASEQVSSSRAEFLAAKEQHFSGLAARSTPGAAWFRHLARQANAELGGATQNGAAAAPGRTRPWESELEHTFEMFSGGRAISENLQLDRTLAGAAGGEPVIDTNTLEGISVAAIDWTPLVKDLRPAMDPLAPAIPEDQHGLFFASFQAMIDVIDEADRHGTPIVEAIEWRSEDALTRDRYERQLLLGMTDLGRLLGPAVVASVAVTGSDPYLRMGSDVAVLFEARARDVLKGFVEAKQAAALKANPTARKLDGEAEGLKYTAVVSPDRVVSSYLAVHESTVIVANSLVQLRNIGQTLAKKRAALSDSQEYVYFRDRYRRGEEVESAFLILTDATIRRWASARWRIGDSRRVRAAAVLAAMTAERIEHAAGGTPGDRELAALAPVPGGGKFHHTPGGPVSEGHGTLAFLTPIAELDVSRATEAEAQAYRRFRDRYQQSWRQFFDPIAVRVSAGKKRLAADLSVLPLIAGSEFNELIELTRGGEIQATHGDPHPDTLVHLALGIDVKSRLFTSAGGFVSNSLPGLRANPFAWMGTSISVYADAAPRWSELAGQVAATGRVDELSALPELPVALHVEVRDALGVTAFLAAVRAFVDGAAPDQAVWEVRKHNETSYVRVGPGGDLQRQLQTDRSLAIYYAVGDGGLVLSLNEGVVQRAIDRRLERRKVGEEGKEKDGEALRGASPWLGKHVALRASRQAIDLAGALFREDYARMAREKSWANLPILNEWRRLFPEEDPVKAHERLWGTRLVCPLGGKYVWNGPAATMESTACGHPTAPRGEAALPAVLESLERASFGLEFEQSGLRARVEIERR